MNGNTVDAGDPANGGIYVADFPTVGKVSDNTVNGTFVTYDGVTTSNNRVTGSYSCRNIRANTPDGAIDPAFIGERVIDSTAHKEYFADGLANTDWNILN